jgi:hypothetical protein
MNITGEIGTDSRGIGKWRDSMLVADSGWFMAMASNYVGKVRTPFDKREVLRKIESLLSSEEVQDNFVKLLDRFDLLILGSIIAAGPISEAGVKALFLGEIPLSDISFRLANLQDRLLVYRETWPDKTLLDINPLLRGEIEVVANNAYALFAVDEGQVGSFSEGRISGMETEHESRHAETRLSIEEIVFIVLSFLLAYPAASKSDGKLKSKAAQALHSLLSRDPDSEKAALTVIDAFRKAGADLGAGSESCELLEITYDFLSRGSGTPAWTFLVTLTGMDTKNAGVFASLFEGFFEHGFEFSRTGLSRFLRTIFYRYRIDGNEESVINALLDLSLLVETENGYICDAERISRRRVLEIIPNGAVAVLEGSGILHLVGAAGKRDMIFLAAIADLSSVAETWTYELGRESIFRAFSVGMSAEAILARLAILTGREVPQALVFSISSWEEEYNAVRIYHGTFVMTNHIAGAAIEKSGEFTALSPEKITDGLYFFGNTPISAIGAALTEIGIDRKAMSRGPACGQKKASRLSELLNAENEEKNDYRFEPKGDTILSLAFGVRPPIESQSLGKKVALRFTERVGNAKIDLTAKAEFEERIARKLIYSERQIKDFESSFHGMVSEIPPRLDPVSLSSEDTRSKVFPNPRGTVARAMDYQGKLRMIQAAMKSAIDRLEIRWMREGGIIDSVVVRPVHLEKNEKDQILEAENLKDGETIRIRVGAMVTVHLLKGSYFGDKKN